MNTYVLPLESVTMRDVEVVGGKNASIGEMIGQLTRLGVQVPGGFATTAAAYREFLQQQGLNERIRKVLADLDVDDVTKLAATGAQIRQWILQTPFPAELERAVLDSFDRMCDGRDIAVAVRSSATAEDLPEASFAGQQETFLNVRGKENVLKAMHDVFASLFNDRAIAYRVHQSFDHNAVALSAGVQHMVRSDIGASGVMFTLDTDSGFREVVFVTASYGLGETVVQGAVNPDEFYVYKAGLRANKPCVVRRNLGTKAIKMVYAETGGGERVRTVDVAPADRARFCIDDAGSTGACASGADHRRALQTTHGYRMGQGRHHGRDLHPAGAARDRTKSRRAHDSAVYAEEALHDPDDRSQHRAAYRRGPGTRHQGHRTKWRACRRGDVLVADMTDPDWEPVMKRAAAIVTNRGGRTCHAAIIARELGIPAVVGCGDATTAIKEGQEVTVSCAEGDTGYVYQGALEFEQKQIELDSLPPLPVKIMMNVGNPDRAFDFAGIPHNGVGLARLEFIINRMIGVHPRALLEFDQIDADTQGTDPRADGRLFRSGRLLCRQAGRRHLTDRRRIRTGTGDRTPV